MVKKIAVGLLCTALGSSLCIAGNVSEAKGFIGVEVGYATIRADVGGYFPDFNHDGTDVEYGFRLGAQTDEWRTMLLYDYFDSDGDDQNYEKGLFELDYFFLSSSSDYTSEAFRPYIGLNIGYMNYESEGIDENGLLYGGQVGFAYAIAENFDLDIMYRYSLTDASRTDHIDSFLLGINWLY